MSIDKEVKGVLLLSAYAVSWTADQTFALFFILYFSVFKVLIALINCWHIYEFRKSFYRTYLLNWWLLQLAMLLLFWDLFQGHEVTFGFGLFFSISLSFGIVILNILAYFGKADFEDEIKKYN
jgi:hypothetical protein